MKPTGATKEATGHSPLPWSVGRNDRIESAEGRVVADMTFSSYSERRAPANAALIVTAVNERERLREALTQIAAFNDTGANEVLQRTGSYSGFDEPGAVQIARAALNEVEG